MSQVLKQSERVKRRRKQARLPKATSIYVTVVDYERLMALIERTRERNGVDLQYLKELEEELDRAEVVDPGKIPPDVITLNSKVRLKDLVSGEEQTYSLVLPAEADFTRGKVSVLAPIGTAILGYRRGDTIEWTVPSGLRRLRVDEVLYQPEAAEKSSQSSASADNIDLLSKRLGSPSTSGS
jgi:regulator of nucleoside diphosphate kinase